MNEPSQALRREWCAGLPVPAEPVRRSFPGRAALRRAFVASARVLGSVRRVETAEPVAALTFDDGPDPDSTPAILDRLERHGARATFFTLGARARRHPDLVRRAAGAGHAIACHSWEHVSLRLITGRYRRAQLRWWEEATRPHGTRLFRPPYGEMGPGARLDLWRLGWLPVSWDVNAEDWSDDPAEVIAGRILGRLAPGSIVLAHDALATAREARFRDRRPTLEALDLVLSRTRGTLRFVTVPELMRLGRPERWHWYRRADLDWLRGLDGEP